MKPTSFSFAFCISFPVLFGLTTVKAEESFPCQRVLSFEQSTRYWLTIDGTPIYIYEFEFSYESGTLYEDGRFVRDGTGTDGGSEYSDNERYNATQALGAVYQSLGNQYFIEGSFSQTVPNFWNTEATAFNLTTVWKNDVVIYPGTIWTMSPKSGGGGGGGGGSGKIGSGFDPADFSFPVIMVEKDDPWIDVTFDILGDQSVAAGFDPRNDELLDRLGAGLKKLKNLLTGSRNGRLSGDTVDFLEEAQGYQGVVDELAGVYTDMFEVNFVEPMGDLLNDVSNALETATLQGDLSSMSYAPAAESSPDPTAALSSVDLSGWDPDGDGQDIQPIHGVFYDRSGMQGGVIYGAGQVHSIGVDPGLVSELDKLKNEGAFVNDVAIDPDGSGWVVLSNHDGWTANSLHGEALDALDYLWENNHRIHQFAYDWSDDSGDSWMILYGDGEVYYYGIDPVVGQKIDEISNRGDRIKKIRSLPNSGAVFVCEEPASGRTYLDGVLHENAAFEFYDPSPISAPRSNTKIVDFNFSGNGENFILQEFEVISRSRDSETSFDAISSFLAERALKRKVKRVKRKIRRAKKKGRRAKAKKLRRKVRKIRRRLRAV